MLSCEFLEIFKNTFFIEHMRVTASVTVVSYFKSVWVFLKADSHIPEKFDQIKILPSLVQKNTIICLFGI